ncbi:MAG: phosphoribosyltransferase family protein [Thermodesulfobacteriota bacterium]|nr:phosphoribosyltransferase family protein [Thermodesulfobacteriota bacterium]
MLSNINRKRLKTMIIDMALRSQSVTLSSGKSSEYYIDGKIVASDPDGGPLIADAIKDIIGTTQIDSVGGPTIGADFMLGALSGKGYFRTFIIRKAPKEYGLNKWIEGQLNENDKKVAIIDDVATTGGSILKAIEAVKGEFPRVEIVKVVVLVDREEGAKEKLKEKGYAMESVFKANELFFCKKNDIFQ